MPRAIAPASAPDGHLRPAAPRANRADPLQSWAPKAAARRVRGPPIRSTNPNRHKLVRFGFRSAMGELLDCRGANAPWRPLIIVCMLRRTVATRRPKIPRLKRAGRTGKECPRTPHIVSPCSSRYQPFARRSIEQPFPPDHSFRPTAAHRDRPQWTISAPGSCSPPAAWSQA